LLDWQAGTVPVFFLPPLMLPLQTAATAVRLSVLTFGFSYFARGFLLFVDMSVLSLLSWIQHPPKSCVLFEMQALNSATGFSKSLREVKARFDLRVSVHDHSASEKMCHALGG
jgi:hypothetical protein